MENTGNILGGLLISIVVTLVVALIFREIVCWYWKVNQGIALMTEIRDLLAKGQAAVPAAVPTAVPASPPENRAEGHWRAARNLAASGHSAKEISKELQQWRGVSPEEADALAAEALKKA